MKYLYLLLASFLIVLPANAAKLVPGSVPNLPPLQAPPEDTFPNYQNNIVDSPAFHNSQTSQNQSSGTDNTDQNFFGQTQNSDTQGQGGRQPGVLGLAYKKWFWVFLIFGVVLVYAYFKTRKKE